MCKRVYKAREHSQLYSSSKGKGLNDVLVVVTINEMNEFLFGGSNIGI